MILRKYPISLLSVFFVFSFAVAQNDSDSGFDCHLSVDSFKYDLTTLAGERTLSRTRDTPPTVMEDIVRFDLCAELGVKDGDQCPAGTRACLTKINKMSNEKDRVIAVIPLAQTSSLLPAYFALSTPRGLSLVLHGASYPHPTTAVATQQSLNITLLCATDLSDPKFLEYDGAQLRVEWSAPGGCGFQGEEPSQPAPEDGSKDDQKKDEKVGSGIGFFFFLVFLTLAAYFGLGAYYNYSTYGATGVDLIPHRDFWREMPYMLHDVVSHLCSTVRPRYSNRGYHAV